MYLFSLFSFPFSLQVNLTHKLLKEFQEKEEKRGRPPGEGWRGIDTIDEKMIKKISFYSRIEWLGLCIYMGGRAAMEVLKKWGKMTPMQGWCYIDYLNILGEGREDGEKEVGKGKEKEGEEMGEEEFLSSSSRYAHQIALFGEDFQRKLSTKKWLLVGCGGLGGEFLKTLVMMGVGVGGGEERGEGEGGEGKGGGGIYVVDDDVVELENLRSHVLCRGGEEGRVKVEVGRERVLKEINGEARIFVKKERLVSPGGREREEGEGEGKGKGEEEREGEFELNQEFFLSLDGICMTADNEITRKYGDFCAVTYEKPMLVGGILGGKCSGEVILPHQTSCYRDVMDPQSPVGRDEMVIPGEMRGCVQWSCREFLFLCEEMVELTKAYLESEEGIFDKKLEELGPKKRDMIGRYLLLLKERTYEACIQVAFDYFTLSFSHQIQDLTHAFPPNHGTPPNLFWNGSRRFPRPVHYSPTMELDNQFLFSLTNLFAHLLSLPPLSNMTDFKSIFDTLSLTPLPWSPPKDEDPSFPSLAPLHSLLPTIPPAHQLQTLTSLNPNNTTHMDFITTASNLRAYNHHIPLSPLSPSSPPLSISSSLAPSISVTIGLLSLEFTKIALEIQDRIYYRNFTANLQLSSSVFLFEPQPPLVREAHFDEIMGDLITPLPLPSLPDSPPPPLPTCWDRIVIQNNQENPYSIRTFLDIFGPMYGKDLTIEFLILRRGEGGRGDNLVWGSEESLPPGNFLKKMKEREGREVVEVVGEMLGWGEGGGRRKGGGGRGVPEGERFVVFEVACGENGDGECMELPLIHFYY